jgi:hypothetical protein
MIEVLDSVPLCVVVGGRFPVHFKILPMRVPCLSLNNSYPALVKSCLSFFRYVLTDHFRITFTSLLGGGGSGYLSPTCIGGSLTYTPPPSPTYGAAGTSQAAGGNGERNLGEWVLHIKRSLLYIHDVLMYLSNLVGYAILTPATHSPAYPKSYTSSNFSKPAANTVSIYDTYVHSDPPTNADPFLHPNTYTVY